MAHKFDKTLYALFFAVPLLLDRLVKYLIVCEFVDFCEVTPFCNFYIAYNSGIAWGLGSQYFGIHLSILNLLIAAILIYFVWYMRLLTNHRMMFGASLLVLSGGISNFYDRVTYGCVIDFIQMHASGYYFPVFNIADIAITVGVVMLMWFMMRQEKIV